jgi:hypothetical protein
MALFLTDTQWVAQKLLIPNNYSVIICFIKRLKFYFCLLYGLLEDMVWIESFFRNLISRNFFRGLSIFKISTSLRRSTFTQTQLKTSKLMPRILRINFKKRFRNEQICFRNWKKTSWGWNKESWLLFRRFFDLFYSLKFYFCFVSFEVKERWVQGMLSGGEGSVQLSSLHEPV